MSSTSGFDLRVTGPAERQLAALPTKVAAAIVEFKVGPLLDDPERVGAQLHRELSGLRSARRGAYRVVYEIDERRRLVIIHLIDHRADVYRPR